MTSDISALSHLIAVVKITTKSRDIALAALHEARTKPVAYGRVFQLKQVAQDLHREVHRLVAAMEKLEAENPAVHSAGERRDSESYDRSMGKPVRTAAKQEQLDSLARIARMVSGAGPATRDEKKLRRNMDCLT